MYICQLGCSARPTSGSPGARSNNHLRRPLEFKSHRCGLGPFELMGTNNLHYHLRIILSVLLVDHTNLRVIKNTTYGDKIYDSQKIRSTSRILKKFLETTSTSMNPAFHHLLTNQFISQITIELAHIFFFLQINPHPTKRKKKTMKKNIRYKRSFPFEKKEPHAVNRCSRRAHKAMSSLSVALFPPSSLDKASLYIITRALHLPLERSRAVHAQSIGECKTLWGHRRGLVIRSHRERRGSIHWVISRALLQIWITFCSRQTGFRFYEGIWNFFFIEFGTWLGENHVETCLSSRIWLKIYGVIMKLIVTRILRFLEELFLLKKYLHMWY